MKKIMIIGLLCAMAHGAHAQKQYTLDECVDSALVYNRTLQNAAYEIEAAKHQRKEAWTKYFPEISANVMAFRTFDKLVKSDAMQLEELNSGHSVSVSAIQPLYAGGQIVNGNRLTKIQEEVCRLQLELTEKEVAEKVTENYWQICTIRYNLRTIEAAERQLEAVTQQVESYVKAGVTTGNALLQVRLRQNELSSNKLKLQNAEKTLLMLLAVEVGQPEIDIMLPEEFTEVSSPLMKDETAAVGQRRELELLGKAVDAQRLQIKMERGKNLPTVAVGIVGYNMGIGGLSDKVEAMTETSFTNGAVMGTVSVPISSWWGGSHAIERQKLKLKVAENNVADTREKLRIDIASSWNNLTEAYEQVTIAQSSVEESEENLRMLTEQYRSGTVGLTDLLDAETLNRKSHDQLASAIASYHISLMKYQLKTE